MNKLLTVSALTVAFVLTSVSTAQAAGTWYDNCKIERVGVDESGAVLIKLIHADFAGTTGWFKITVATDRALSIALTALSSGRSLKIKADTSAATGQYYGRLYVLYINR